MRYAHEGTSRLAKIFSHGGGFFIYTGKFFDIMAVRLLLILGSPPVAAAGVANGCISTFWDPILDQYMPKEEG